MHSQAFSKAQAPNASDSDIYCRSPAGFPDLAQVETFISFTGDVQMIDKRVFALAASCVLLHLSSTCIAQEDAPMVEEQDSVVEGQRCVSSRPIRKTEVLDDQNILFYFRGATIYLNHLPKPCKGLSREGRFMYRTTVARLCRADIINVMAEMGSGIGLGRACKLGNFYAITKEDVEKLKSPRVVEPKSIPPAEPEEPGTGNADDSERTEHNEQPQTEEK